MALPFLPHHGIPPMFQRLRLQAQAQSLRDLVNYIERNIERCHSDLGIPIPKSLVKWVSPSNMAAVFLVSPGTLPGYPEP